MFLCLKGSLGIVMHSLEMSILPFRSFTIVCLSVCFSFSFFSPHCTVSAVALVLPYKHHFAVCTPISGLTCNALHLLAATNSYTVNDLRSVLIYHIHVLLKGGSRQNNQTYCHYVTLILVTRSCDATPIVFFYTIASALV